MRLITFHTTADREAPGVFPDDLRTVVELEIEGLGRVDYRIVRE